MIKKLTNKLFWFPVIGSLVAFIFYNKKDYFPYYVETWKIGAWILYQIASSIFIVYFLSIYFKGGI